MRLAMTLGLLIAASPAAFAEDARTLATEILNKGSATFDSRDAKALADTYTEGAKLTLVVKDRDSGTWKSLGKEGRAEIEESYRDLFKNGGEPTTSRNTVEFATRVAPDLLVIQGTFEPDVTRGKKYTFVQERTEQGGRWLISNLRLYVAD